MKKKKQSKSNGVNWKVVGYSFLALGFVALSFFIDWIFIVGAVLMIYLNQKELMRK